MTIEERMANWLKQPGTFVTRAEDQFIVDMRNAAADGVGYGWMQQVIEWECQAKGRGSHGPESHGAEIERIAALERDLSVEVAAGHDSTERAEAAEREIERLQAALREAKTIIVCYAPPQVRAEQSRKIDAALSRKGEL